MTKVKTNSYGIIHYYAQCEKCNWDLGIDYENDIGPKDVKKAARAHVKLSNHNVSISEGREMMLEIVE
jgi:hypothetical protein